MQHTMAATASRTVWFSRLLLALSMALVLGLLVGPEVDAKKKGKDTIASVSQRVARERKICEGWYGTFTVVSQKPGGTTTKCEGSAIDSENQTCTFHSKGKRCHPNPTRTSQPESPLGGVVAPPSAGVHEDPTVGGGGGRQPSGGATAPPPTVTDSDGGEPVNPIIQ
jgi:hypothetical protein